MNERAVLSLLLSGCAAFAVAIVLELRAAPGDPGAGAPAAHRPARLAAGPARAAPELSQLVAATLARPLFNPNRRPAGRDADGSAGAGIADMRLTGIVTGPGERLAIFAVTGAKPLIVGEGGEVSGWRIETITPGAVSLSGPGGTERLQPKPDASLVRAAPPPPALPAPARFAGPARMGFLQAARPGFPAPLQPNPAGSR